MVTVFLSILNQMDFHLVQNQKESCHHDHIPFNVKGNGNRVFSVYGQGFVPQKGIRDGWDIFYCSFERLMSLGMMGAR